MEFKAGDVVRNENGFWGQVEKVWEDGRILISVTKVPHPRFQANMGETIRFYPSDFASNFTKYRLVRSKPSNSGEDD